MPTRQRRGLLIAAAVVAALACVAAALVLSQPALRRALGNATEAGRRTACATNLVQIARALVSYEEEHGHFPAVRAAPDPAGTARSWRVEILPHLGSTDLVRQYDDGEPWDGPANRELGRFIPAVYRCPSTAAGPGDETTGYVMIAGPGALGGLDDAERTTDHVARFSGTSLTLLVVELPGAGIHWMDPRDPTVDEVVERLGKRDPRVHGGRMLAAFCDGHVRILHADVSLDTIRALADPERTEPVDLSDLDR